MRLTGLFVLLLSVSACKTDKEKAIVGKWNADNLVECDDVVPIVANLVNIEFKSDGRYIFNSTLNIHEEGTYKIKKNHLFLQDKIRDKAVEKIVLITKLTSDSMVLEMNFKGKEQWLTFVKENISIPKPNKTKGSEDSTIASKNGSHTAPAASAAIATSAAAGAKDEPKPVVKVEEKPKAEPVKVVKKEEPKVEKKPESKPLTRLEAYRKREAQRQEEEADRKNEEKKRHNAYLKREAQRKKEEAERKRRLKK